ncbi:MAG: DUF167 family protein [Candidatus Bathyarchaeota archaeon]|jgi:uncharacterized protein
MKIQTTDDGVILNMNVKPNAKEFKIKIEEDEIIVMCNETPVKGKVNKKLLQHFSRLFGRRVELISGFTSKRKKFLIHNIKAEEANQILISSN